MNSCVQVQAISTSPISAFYLCLTGLLQYYSCTGTLVIPHQCLLPLSDQTLIVLFMHRYTSHPPSVPLTFVSLDYYSIIHAQVHSSSPISASYLCLTRLLQYYSCTGTLLIPHQCLLPLSDWTIIVLFMHRYTPHPPSVPLTSVRLDYYSIIHAQVHSSSPISASYLCQTGLLQYYSCTGTLLIPHQCLLPLSDWTIIVLFMHRYTPHPPSVPLTSV